MPISGPGRSRKCPRPGADLVITGRVADPSLTVAPCVHWFGWSWDDWDRLAGATVAGPLDRMRHAGHRRHLDRLAAYARRRVHRLSDCRGRLGRQLRRHQTARQRRPGLRGDGQGTTSLRDRRPGRYLSPDATSRCLGSESMSCGEDRVRSRRAGGRRRRPTRSARRTRTGFGPRGVDGLRRRRLGQGPTAGEAVLSRLAAGGVSFGRQSSSVWAAGLAVPRA